MTKIYFQNCTDNNRRSYLHYRTHSLPTYNYLECRPQILQVDPRGFLIRPESVHQLESKRGWLIRLLHAHVEQALLDRTLPRTMLHTVSSNIIILVGMIIQVQASIAAVKVKVRVDVRTCTPANEAERESIQLLTVLPVA